MNEIKFKYYWSNGSNVISRVFTLDEIQNGDNYDYTSDSPMLRDYRLIDRCQFSGCCDKTGVEIYNRDILSSAEDGSPSIAYLVEFSNGAFRTDGMPLVKDRADRLFVVGNKHQNPDLWEKCL